MENHRDIGAPKLPQLVRPLVSEPHQMNDLGRIVARVGQPKRAALHKNQNLPETGSGWTGVKMTSSWACWPQAAKVAAIARTAAVLMKVRIYFS